MRLRWSSVNRKGLESYLGSKAKPHWNGYTCMPWRSQLCSLHLPRQWKELQEFCPKTQETGFI